METSSSPSENDIILMFHFTSIHKLFAGRINVVCDSLTFVERVTYNSIYLL